MATQVVEGERWVRMGVVCERCGLAPAEVVELADGKAIARWWVQENRRRGHFLYCLPSVQAHLERHRGRGRPPGARNFRPRELGYRVWMEGGVVVALRASSDASVREIMAQAEQIFGGKAVEVMSEN